MLGSMDLAIKYHSMHISCDINIGNYIVIVGNINRNIGNLDTADMQYFIAKSMLLLFLGKNNGDIDIAIPNFQ